MHFFLAQQHTLRDSGSVMAHNTQNGQGVSALDFVPTHVELQLGPSAEFTRRGYGRKVVRAHGHFSPVRGNTRYRFVHLPVSQPQLVDELVREFPGGPYGTTLVFRGGNAERLPAWAVVQSAPRGTKYAFAHAVDEFDKARQQAINRGIISSY